MSGIDLIHSETWWGPGDNSGLLNFAKAQPGAGPGEIRDISFRDVRLEGKTLRLVGLTPHHGQKINDIRFANVSVESWRHDAGSSERSNYLDANDGSSINGVTFDNVMVGGQVLTQANSSTLGRLKASGDVSNITFRN